MARAVVGKAALKLLCLFLAAPCLVWLSANNFNFNFNTHPSILPSTTSTSTSTSHGLLQHHSLLDSLQLESQDELVYVCITGQLSRLELLNKIQKLFTPLGRMGFKLYFALAVTTSGARYVNKDNGDKMRLFTSISQVTETLMSLNGAVGVEHISEVDRQPQDIYMNEFYQKSLRYVNTTYRVEMNARQFRLLQYCDLPEITNRASFFIRVREDTFVDRIAVEPIVDQAKKGYIVTTKCDSWWGINDKIAFGPSSRASIFFRTPFEYYMSFNSVVENYNPEQLYMNAYLNSGFKLNVSDDFVVTKANTAIIRNMRPEKYSNGTKKCRVSGNPFQKWSKMCPPRGVSRTLKYSAQCWNN